MNNHLNKFKTAGLVLVLLAGPLSTFAWTPAPTTPPTGNVSEPLNVGSQTQIKSGYLLINTDNNATGLLVSGLGAANGKVGIGTGSTPPGYKLQVGNGPDGSAIAASIFLYLSDATLKTNISTLPDALSKILSLKGVSFNWKQTGTKAIGVIAQDVEKVYPDLVSTDPVTGLKSVQEANLVAPLIEAVKAQQAEINALKARISALEAK